MKLIQCYFNLHKCHADQWAYIPDQEIYGIGQFIDEYLFAECRRYNELQKQTGIILVVFWVLILYDFVG
jgi:hypothetical protein